ncbi:GGDEF domain-containing protein [Paenibacillus sp. DMB5]|uniref:sensor domain-containing diguanylate cyclase n=1 Tax=Paenibacillus sp. DMB5 TaxID=1780103 RepID=UPI00076D0063|nr:GGDEF domain-containing protein [Paenibacillus sp. DMB5]KUP25816.1 hypothetical protein AWJ19_19525 [Paenibacillus sp. DMB5]
MEREYPIQNSGRLTVQYNYTVEIISFATLVGLFLLIITVIHKNCTLRERRKKNLLSYIGDRFVIVNRKGAIYCNTSLLGEKPSIMRSSNFTNWMDIMHPHDILVLCNSACKIFREGNTDKIEIRLNVDGNIKYLECILRPFVIKNGEVSEIIMEYKDITERIVNEQKMKKTIKHFKEIKFALDESILIEVLDSRANIIYANNQFCNLSGYPLDELIGKNIRLFNSKYHSKEFFEDMWKTVSIGEVWRGDIRNQSKKGSYFWVNTTIVPFLNDNNKPHQYIVIRTDITKNKEYEEKLELWSNVDGLTTLFNRRYFEKQLSEYWEQHYLQKQPLALILFDVDYFKSYNDHNGHIMGDQCLVLISDAVKQVLSSYEAVAARYGGEEFVIILPGKRADDAFEIAETLRMKVIDLQIPHAKSIENQYVTMSSGVASIIPKEEKNIDNLKKRADIALYQAKNNGRNCTVMWNSEGLVLYE